MTMSRGVVFVLTEYRLNWSTMKDYDDDDDDDDELLAAKFQRQSYKGS